MGDGIYVRRLKAWFGSALVIKGVDLTIAPNAVTAIIGPSGCGKSTFVRCLNRMHETVPTARVEGEVAHIPEKMVRDALATAPREFALYTRAGEAVVRYGGDQAQFDPGSSCLNILDPETKAARPAESADLVRLVQVAEALPQFAAQATALVCHDVPSALGDFYRLFLVLLHSNKPVVTGAFSVAGLRPMLELLAADSGSQEALRRRPRQARGSACDMPIRCWPRTVRRLRG